MKEILVTGKHYRVLADSVNNIWHRISYWTKASDVEFDDGSRLEGKTFGHCILKRGKEYAVGDIAYCTNAPSWVRLVCTTAGTTAGVEPNDYKAIIESGVTITDGSAVFQVDDVRPATSMSNSIAEFPSVGLLKKVNDKAVEAQTQLANINLYVGDDEKLHFVDRTGADTGLNFNPHGATYTLKKDDKKVDLGELHKYQYINAQNVYAQGYSDGMNKRAAGITKIVYHFGHKHTGNAQSGGGCYNVPHTETYTVTVKDYKEQNIHHPPDGNCPNGGYVNGNPCQCGHCVGWDEKKMVESGSHQETRKRTTYSLGCGLEERQEIRTSNAPDTHDNEIMLSCDFNYT